MAIDIMVEKGQLPKISRRKVKEQGRDEIVEYLERLAKHLQEDLLRKMIQIQNIQLQLMNVGVFYYDLPDVNGVYPEGSFKSIKVSDGIELQRMNDSDTWVKVTRSSL